jgi:hypothetical protein
MVDTAGGGDLGSASGSVLTGDDLRAYLSLASNYFFQKNMLSIKK